jgi:hypothetical protein
MVLGEGPKTRFAVAKQYWISEEKSMDSEVSGHVPAMKKQDVAGAKVGDKLGVLDPAGTSCNCSHSQATDIGEVTKSAAGKELCTSKENVFGLQGFDRSYWNIENATAEASKKNGLNTMPPSSPTSTFGPGSAIQFGGDDHCLKSSDEEVKLPAWCLNPRPDYCRTLPGEFCSQGKSITDNYPVGMHFSFGVTGFGDEQMDFSLLKCPFAYSCIGIGPRKDDEDVDEPEKIEEEILTARYLAEHCMRCPGCRAWTMRVCVSSHIKCKLHLPAWKTYQLIRNSQVVAVCKNCWPVDIEVMSVKERQNIGIGNLTMSKQEGAGHCNGCNDACIGSDWWDWRGV